MSSVLEAMRDPAAVRYFVGRIQEKVARLGRPLRMMEICGTHTVAIARTGIRSVLAGTVDLVSGPGCPVCVTSDWEIDRMLAHCDVPGAILATYGDLMRVPGSKTTLLKRRAAGADVRIVYSPLDAVTWASQEPDRPVIFLGIGFETTTPASALALERAMELGLQNFYVHSVHKLTPPAMKALLAGGGARLDGFLCPGHVSTVLGADGFAFLATEYGMPGAIAGFEPMDILLGVDYLASVALGEEPVELRNTYSRWVPTEGNRRARELVQRYYIPAAAQWRGLGTIPESGLALRPEYAAYDADAVFPAEVPQPKKRACRCGEVLRGEIKPPECPVFGKACTPESPVGPCMVSGEGACAAYYKYQ